MFREKKDYYGEVKVLKDYCQLKTYGAKKQFTIQHAVAPSYLDDNVEALVGESGEESVYKSRPILVATKYQKRTLEKNDFPDVTAIGNSILYLNETEKIERIKDSIVFFPKHSTPENSNSMPVSEEYTNFILQHKKFFKKVSICLYGLDYNSKYVKKLKNIFGQVEIIRGAAPWDTKSLKRISKILKQNEYVNSEGRGTHVFYALYVGARVSLYLDTKQQSPQEFLNRARINLIYRNSPKALNKIREYDQHVLNSDEYSFLRRLPKEAETNTSWAKMQLGFDQKKSPGEIAEILKNLYFTSIYELFRTKFVRYGKKTTISIYQFIKLQVEFGLFKNLINLIKKPILYGEDRLGQIFVKSISRELYYRKKTSDFKNINQHFLHKELFEIPWQNYENYLDLGCYCGYSIIVARHLNPRIKIFGLEPFVSNYEIAKMNTIKDKNVKILNAAIWIHNDGVRLFESSEGFWAWQVREKENYLNVSKVTQSMTIQKIFSVLNIEKMDLIKLDIEGAEALIMEKHGEFIFSNCSNVLVEVHDWIPGVEDKFNRAITNLRDRFRFQITYVGEYTFFQNVERI